jgi:tRNA (guanosine-2'-O-)-methyltransferase
MNAQELRHGDVKEIQAKYNATIKNNIYVIVDSVCDTANLGMICRISDQIGAREVIFTGKSLTPPNKQIEKSSIMISKVINWSYAFTVQQAIRSVRSVAKQIVALELTDDAVNYREFEYQQPIGIVLGNESTGVSKEALDLVDAKIKIPMWGINNSMNVTMSLAVVGNHIVNE